MTRRVAGDETTRSGSGPTATGTGTTSGPSTGSADSSGPSTARRTAGPSTVVRVAGPVVASTTMAGPSMPVTVMPRMLLSIQTRDSTDSHTTDATVSVCVCATSTP